MRNGIDHRELSSLMWLNPVSASGGTSARPPMYRKPDSATNSTGPRPIEQAAREGRAERPGGLEELGLVDRDVRLRAGGRRGEIGGHGREMVQADGVPDERREPGAREIPPLSAFEAPVAVITELHRQGGGFRPEGAELHDLRGALGIDEVEVGFGPRTRAVADADLEQAHLPVDGVEARVVRSGSASPDSLHPHPARSRH